MEHAKFSNHTLSYLDDYKNGRLGSIEWMSDMSIPLDNAASLFQSMDDELFYPEIEMIDETFSISWTGLKNSSQHEDRIVIMLYDNKFSVFVEFHGDEAIYTAGDFKDFPLELAKSSITRFTVEANEKYPYWRNLFGYFYE